MTEPYTGDQDPGPSAYRSKLRITHGPLIEPPAPWLTATITDQNDEQLRELRRRAVDPVVASLLTEAERGPVTVYYVEETGEIGLWLTAVGEAFHHWIMDGRDLGTADPATVGGRLADQLEDFVAQSRFGWGQQRIARYEIPDGPGTLSR